MENVPRTFLYNAQGSALGGVLRRPFEHVIEAQAATSLPITGGYASASVSDFKFKELISFKKAYTQVSGSQNPADGSYNTLVSVTIEGLNIADMVTADRIVARISTQKYLDDTTGETRAIPAGSEFVNLRVAGHPVEPELDSKLFCELDTFQAFKERYQKDREFQQTMRKRFLWGDVDKKAPQALQRRYDWAKGELPESRGIIPCSLIKSVNCDCPELGVYENVIVVPQFGIVYLGELVIKESSKTLTMMRVEMGSPVAGTLTVGDGNGNGTPYP